jgi:hypothetical protein
MYKGILAFVWQFVTAAITAEFPQGYNLPISFSAQRGKNLSEF